MSHTPGKWNVVGGEVFSMDNDARICQVFSGGDSQKLLNKAVSSYEADANARLIAAAPELLEALERMLDECIIPNHRISDIEEKSRAAIAKARGQA